MSWGTELWVSEGPARRARGSTRGLGRGRGPGCSGEAVAVGSESLRPGEEARVRVPFGGLGWSRRCKPDSSSRGEGSWWGSPAAWSGGSDLDGPRGLGRGPPCLRRPEEAA